MRERYFEWEKVIASLGRFERASKEMCCIFTGDKKIQILFEKFERFSKKKYN